MTMPAIMTAALLAIATLVSVIRLILWRRAAGADAGVSWRFATLLFLQPLCSAALYLTLFPPPTMQSAGTLRIATAGTPVGAALASGSPLIALPEAGRVSGAKFMPDLATALRRYPGTSRIILLGAGLIPRDLDATRSVDVVFNPSPAADGIIALTPPDPVAPGATFAVSGQISGKSSGRIELLDPSGRRTDASSPDATGFFHLRGTVRSPGLTGFTVRLKYGSRLIEQAQIPVVVTAATKPRLLIAAAAPNAETKYLRRWASDAGMDAVAQMQAGAGVALGDPVTSIDPATLARFDAVIFDDRSWAALGARRSAVLGAVANGLGLILHPSGALDASTRAQWQTLGFAWKGGSDLAPLSLPPVVDTAMEATRLGIGRDDQPADTALPDDPLPDLNRLATEPGGAETVPLLRDGSGSTIAALRASGTGRIAIFTPVDSYGLALTGRRALYESWWSQLLSAVLRPATQAAAFKDIYWLGERAILCGINAGAVVRAPDGRASELLPVDRCGAYWPTVAGWHRLEDGGQVRPFFVQPGNALPALRSARDTIATQLLPSRNENGSALRSAKHPMPSWPFALAWLVVSALLWWLERARAGRSPPPQSAM